MARRVLVAGATGAIGLPLCRLLVADGWNVFGTTRRVDKIGMLGDIGVAPVVADVYDPVALQRSLADIAPEIVVHQLTDLPPALDPAKMAEARQRNGRLRDEGTRNLVAAALAAGAKRIVAQSIAFAYAPGPKPFTEGSPLEPTQLGVISLERQVLAGPMTGLVLRYGRLYGPGTGFAENGPAPLHVDAGADAARRALDRGQGIYNIAEDDGEIDSSRAKADLGWSADFRL